MYSTYNNFNNTHSILGLPDGKILKLVLDVKTRWNSLLYMIERFLNIFRIISVIILDKSTAPDFVTAHELNTIREIKMLLQPFEDLTKKVSDDKFSIMSSILPLVNCVTATVNNSVPVTDIEFIYLCLNFKQIYYLNWTNVLKI